MRCPMTSSPRCGTAVEGPEEFPDFRAYWIERPTVDGVLVFHALLDGCHFRRLVVTETIA